MKKSLLLTSALFLGAFAASAQITITSADIAIPPTVIQQAQDTMPTISAGSAGISQTWNMAALNTHTIDTLNFIAPAWAPEAAQFPGSNLAVGFAGPDSTFAYASNTSSAMTILGNSAVMDFGGGPSTIIQKNTPAEILTNYPSIYLSTFNNNFTTDGTFYFGVDPGIGFVIDSVRQKSVIQKAVNVDAWGTITTPLGSFPSIRYKEIKNNTDSTWVYAFGAWNFFQETIDSSKRYSWWANGVGFPLVDTEVTFVGDTVKSVSWLKATPAASINEYTALSDVNVYPNPAKNNVTFAVESAKVSAVQVYDITGRMIESYPVGSNILSINTSSLANGVYTYSLLGKDKGIVNRGKFTIAR